MRRLLGSRWADAAFAAGLFALAQIELWSGAMYDGGHVFPGSRTVNALVVIPLLTLPLALRRRRPTVSFLLVLSTIAWSAFALGGNEATAQFIAGIASIYSATANGSPPALTLVGAIVAVSANDVRDPHVHGTGDVVWAFGFVGIAWLFGLAVRGRYVRISILEADRDARAREAVAAERARVARELHDVVAHAVSVVVVQSQAAQRLVGVDDGRARESLQAIEETSRVALVEMRRLLGMLQETDGELAPQPALADLPRLVEQVRDAGLDVSLEVDGAPPALSPGVELSAYRVVQEGLTNALKHARGARTVVRIGYGADRVDVEVVDAGGATADGESGGFGLDGMRERVTLYGGELHAGRAPGGGWILRARLPAGT